MAINQIAIRNSQGNFENLFPLTIDKGGTGATTLPGAISNLFPTNYGSAGFPSQVFVTCFSDGFNQSGHCTVGQLFDYASKELYPVGAVYISYNSTSPATLFGGSWTAITGRFPYFNAGTGTGGSNSHSHIETIGWMNGEPMYITQGQSYTGASVGPVPKHFKIFEGGSTETNQNARLDYTSSASTMPAYQTFYAWRRTA